MPPPSTYESYSAVKSLARANADFAAAVAPSSIIIRPPQTRRAWTPLEIERLIYLMRQYGCAWSAIKKVDERMINPQLMDRTQVQLKDKARNMKLDYLKAEQELPEGFEAVTLSRMHKEKLREMNIAVPGDVEEY